MSGLWLPDGVDPTRIDISFDPRARRMGDAVTVNVAEWIGGRL